MKVLLIDPWADEGSNLYLYTYGLASGLADYTDLSVAVGANYKKNENLNYDVLPLFFKYSTKMKTSKLRLIIRGLEYIHAYREIIKYTKKNKYDVIHIEWFLCYKLDIFFLMILKKYCNKIVYTAHNILPHINSNNYINDMNSIYFLVDDILVHGKEIYNEFLSNFPRFKDKLNIQKHGTYLKQKTLYDILLIDKNIKDKINKYNRIYIMFGNMFYNKGTDILLNLWLSRYKNNNEYLLIIAGKKSKEYIELTKLEDKIKHCTNILYLNEYIDDNLLNYLINSSNLIILPYRHASMSGIVFTAAEFSKPVLATRVGSIDEYLSDAEDSFIVKSDEYSISNELEKINSITNKQLEKMGKKLNSNIKSKYSWDKISESLVKDIYMK